MQEPQGEEEPGGEGPRGPHQDEGTKEEPNPLGPHEDTPEPQSLNTASSLRHTEPSQEQPKEEQTYTAQEPWCAQDTSHTKIQQDKSHTQQSPPGLVPQESPPDQGPQESPPDQGPQESPPDQGPQESPPDQGPQESPPDLVHQESPPDLVHQESPPDLVHQESPPCLGPQGPIHNMEPQIKTVLPEPHLRTNQHLSHYSLGTQEPSQHQCAQESSHDPDPHLRLDYQKTLILQEPPLYRPGPEEPPDEEDFPLLVDPLTALGLQEDRDEDIYPGEVVSGPPSPEPGDIFGILPGDHLLALGARRRGVNMTEGVPVPSSEHVAEIVGRQGCKIKALRAKTNTYIKTPVRGEEPVFIVTGRKEDVEMAKREILAAAEHFSIIRATRNKANGLPGVTQGPPNLPGQTTIQVRVPYRVVGLVVGPKGATIKRIQQSTHTYIVTPSRDKEPVFEVTGMPENVDRAREEIEAHITMRTGSLVDMHPDNDFHSNGTDVCMDLLSGAPASLWTKVPAPRRGSGGARNETLSTSSVDSQYYGTIGRDQGPASPFGPPPGGGFTLGADPHTVPPALGTDDCEFGFEFLALDLNTPTAIWSPFETHSGQLQSFTGGPPQRRNSALGGSATPRLSPTLQESGMGLEHPLARRIHSDPVNGLSWMPNQGSLSSFSSSTGYSSSSSLPGSSSVASGSPTDSSSSEGQRKSGRDCVVCYESEVIAALVPCGHNLFCMECAIRICERVLPECPACHAPATQAIRIFS
ncbi:RNA-binding protein MEX3D [Discoglossus pictus]